jgi:hypothetical protein
MRKKNRENWNDEEAAKERADAQEQVERDNEIADLRDILLDAKVRKFLWRIMSRAGMFRTHFNPNAAIMGHNTGQADMGTAILNEILEANPEAWIVMQQDAYQKQIEAAALAAADDTLTKE